MTHSLFRKLGHGSEPIPGLLRRTKAHGGATVKRTGEDALPKGGYVVGVTDDTAVKVKEPRHPVPHKTEQHRVNKGERRLLSRFAAHRDFGTWIDKGTIHMDPVVTTTRKREAMAIGQRHNQQAIFNVKTGEAEPVKTHGGFNETHNV